MPPGVRTGWRVPIDRAALDAFDKHERLLNRQPSSSSFPGRRTVSVWAIALRLEALAAHFELRALDRLVDVEAGDRHGFFRQRRIARAGDDTHFLAISKDLVAEVGWALGIDQQAENLEALLALEARMFLGATEAGLAGADGEIEAEFPQAVAGGWSAKGYICELS